MSRFDIHGTRVPSDREFQVIAGVTLGLKNDEIATLLETTEHVIKNYLRVIYDKLGFWNRVELALWYTKQLHDKGLDKQSSAVSLFELIDK